MLSSQLFKPHLKEEILASAGTPGPQSYQGEWENEGFFCISQNVGAMDHPHRLRVWVSVHDIVRCL